MATNNLDALQLISNHFGISLAFNSHDAADFFKDDFQIVLSGAPNQGILTLMSEVETSKPLDEASSLRFLLQANYAGHGTQFASFCLDPVSGTLHLNQRLDVSAISDTHLIQSVEQFADLTVLWNSRIDDLIDRLANQGEAQSSLESSPEAMIRV